MNSVRGAIFNVISHNIVDDRIRYTDADVDTRLNVWDRVDRSQRDLSRSFQDELIRINSVYRGDKT